MTRLVVHPADTSTDFLKNVYKDFSWTVITSQISEANLSELIASHDRVIFLGHGTAFGLLGWGELIFHEGLLGSLADNAENIFVWCNADDFVEKHNLSGFYTGMFVSEPIEAVAYNLDASSEDIENSNYLFANILHKALCANFNSVELIHYVKTLYSSPECRIINFNSDKLYINSHHDVPN